MARRFNDGVFGNPEINPASFVCDNTSIIGRVIIEKDVIVAPTASIRADEGAPFRICKGCNIQDGVQMHGLFNKFIEVGEEKYSIYIGSHSSIAHGALIHGPTLICKKTFVGFKAIIHNSKIGRNCYIGIGAIVNGVTIAERRFVADGMVVNNQEMADALPMVSPHNTEFNKEVVDYNKGLVILHKKRKKSKK